MSTLRKSDSLVIPSSSVGALITGQSRGKREGENAFSASR